MNTSLAIGFSEGWNERLRSALRDISIDGLLSISVVGSHRQASEIAAVHDIDLVVIVEQIIVDTLRQVESEFQQIAKMIAQPNIVVSVEMRSGPLKPVLPPPGIYHIQLHVLLYDQERCSSQGHQPGVIEWLQHHDVICGMPLTKFFLATTPSKSAVSRHFDYMISVLETRRLSIFTFALQNDEVLRIRDEIVMDDYITAQACLSFIVTTTRNIRRLAPYMTTPEWKTCGDDLIEVLNDSQSLIEKATDVKSHISHADASAIAEAGSMQRDILGALTRMRHALST